MRHSDAAAAEEEDGSIKPDTATNSRTDPPEVESEYKVGTDPPRNRPVQHSFEMDDSAVLTGPQARTGGPSSTRSTMSRNRSVTGSLLRKQFFGGMARHTLGLILLLGVVFLWTLSNFLGSSIFADDTYAKPFFLTYLNTSIFVFAMIPTMIQRTFQQYKNGTLRSDLGRTFSFHSVRKLFARGERNEHGEMDSDDDRSDEAEVFIKPNNPSEPSIRASNGSYTSANSIKDDAAYLDLISTAKLSFAFCILWFGANYFAMGCLQYTTVASATILTSTSSIWTLLIGAISRTEKFTWRKLCGVLASITGIILISRMDLSAPSEPSSNTPEQEARNLMTRALDVFPDKPATELALGDGLALLSAIIYGFYTITLKRSTIKAAPLELHMPTFFGLVGLFNIVLLLPLFPVLHFTGIEPFELPPSRRVWTVLIVNSISSFASDIMWAYAMVFTSPLLVTVGLSLTIPLSLIGEMVVQARYEGWMYWIGAMIVVGSFVFVEREEVREEEEQDQESGMADVEDGLVVASSSTNAGSFVPGLSVGHHQPDHSLPANDDDLTDLMGSDDEDNALRDRLQNKAGGTVHN